MFDTMSPTPCHGGVASWGGLIMASRVTGMSKTVIYPAAAIYTMDQSRPTAQAVAVRDGRFLAIGSLDELSVLDDYTVDNTFATHTLLPGFVEAHSHSYAGGLWMHTYCGFFDQTDPQGKTWAGCKNIEDVLNRLRQAEAVLLDPNEPLLAWGVDPIYFEGEHLAGSHLDQVSAHREILVMHASLHIATVNNALMTAQGITPDTTMEGVPKDGAGWPIGELQEPAAMSLAGKPFRSFWGRLRAEHAIQGLGQLANQAGITTLTDLGNPTSTDPATIAQWQKIVNDSQFPARVSIFNMGNPATDLQAVTATRQKSSDKLRFGHVKVVLDGSIQGYTARLNWPGYLNDRPNGLWLVPPEQVTDLLRPFHEAGLLIHAHCNGDQAVDVFLDSVQELLTETPRFDHRYTVQHSQLTTPAQYKRIKSLGMCANIFSNHTWYWGDQHVTSTVGPDRAARMNSARTALDLGVPLSMHCDAPVTPLGSLHVAWSAVNRVTSSGQTLGPKERITVYEALQAITIGAAYQLKMDHEIGSIAPGKFADLAVLKADPFLEDPMELRNIGVWGTMLGGKTFPSA